MSFQVDTSEGKVDAVEGEVNQSSQLMKRVAELEGEIDKACQEENYDRAGIDNINSQLIYIHMVS